MLTFYRIAHGLLILGWIVGIIWLFHCNVFENNKYFWVSTIGVIGYHVMNTAVVILMIATTFVLMYSYYVYHIARE